MKDDTLKIEDKIGKLKLLALRFSSAHTDIATKIQGKLEILKAIH
jgi:hypothetical protein